MAFCLKKYPVIVNVNINQTVQNIVPQYASMGNNDDYKKDESKGMDLDIYDDYCNDNNEFNSDS